MRAAWWDKIQADIETDEVVVPDANSKHRAGWAIGLGGLIAGTCDLTYAIAFYGAQGVTPIRILQSIATGLLGTDSYQGGWASAGFGVALHFLIAFSAAAVYYLASRKIKALLSWAPVCGALYGAVIYFFMHWIVVPISAAPRFKSTAVSDGTEFAVHVLLIGLPIALLVRRFGSPPSGQLRAVDQN